MRKRWRLFSDDRTQVHLDEADGSSAWSLCAGPLVREGPGLNLVLATVDPAVVVPVLAAAITGFFAWYVQAWRFRREAEDQALQALNHFRDPLLRAAFDLQSRIYNIAARRFLTRYWTGGSDEQRVYALWSTLWLFGQYLGWVEILRREVQYLDLGSKSANEVLQRVLNQVSAAIASDSSGRNDRFIVFRSDQRAIGEFMVLNRPGDARPDCLGYSEFCRKVAGLKAGAASGAVPEGTGVVIEWADRFRDDLDHFAETTDRGELPQRLARIQRRLIDLIDLLDEGRVRYPDLDFRGRLPDLDEAAAARQRQIAFFIWPWTSPWREVERWAERHSLRLTAETPEVRSYRSRPGALGGRLEVTVTIEEEWVLVEGARRWLRWLRKLDGTLRARRGRRIANDLLGRFDRPLRKEGETVPDRLVGWLLRQVKRLRVAAEAPGS